jgi:hypothetical protein
VASSDDTSKIEVQVADEEDAEKLKASISLYNKNVNENMNEEKELKD